MNIAIEEMLNCENRTMNRRNFFKRFGVVLAGIFAGTAKSSEKDLCGGQNGALCPRCKFNEDKAPWERLGCKDCFKECEHFDECLSELNDRERLRIEAAQKMAAGLSMIIYEDVYTIEGSMLRF